MGAKLTSCAGRSRRSSSPTGFANGGIGSRKRPAPGPPKTGRQPPTTLPLVTALRSRPEVVPTTDGDVPALSPAGDGGDDGCVRFGTRHLPGDDIPGCHLIDPVPDVLPLEAAAQWAREKRQSRRQNSTPATPVSLTFAPSVGCGPWLGDETAAAAVAAAFGTSVATGDLAAGTTEPGGHLATLSQFSEATAIAEPSLAAESRDGRERHPDSALPAERSVGSEPQPIVLQPVPKRMRPSGIEHGATSQQAAATEEQRRPPPPSRLFSMPLPPIPDAAAVGRRLPPKPKHLSLGAPPISASEPGNATMPLASPEKPASSTSFLGVTSVFGRRLPSSPPLPPRSRPPGTCPSVTSADWTSVETLEESASLGQAHWDIVPEDEISCGGSSSYTGDLAADSSSAYASNETSASPTSYSVCRDDRPAGAEKRQAVTFANAIDNDEVNEQQQQQQCHAALQSAASSQPAKCPRKPPRTYSYKAASQPKRISHTTEEFEEMWEAVRRALSLERLAEEANSDCEDDDGSKVVTAATDDAVDDDDIYQNMYATRMRCWQVLSLAQDIVLDLVDPDAVLDFLRSLDLLSDDDYDAIINVTSDRRERNDALIDLLLERGDGYYDKCREFLRAGGSSYSGELLVSESLQTANHRKVGRILDALNETFIIGSKANRWNFSLTTRQCSVGYDQPTMVDDDAKDNVAEIADGNGSRRPLPPALHLQPLQPTVRLDIYNENFGDRSCAAVADMLATYDVVSRLSLVKNGIGRAGARRLAPGLVGRTSLRKLSLRLNPLRNAGLAELAANALCRADCHLAELSLSHTGLSRGAGSLLADALSSGGAPQLYRLDLSHNELDDADCSALAGGLQHHSTLSELSLRDNVFGPAGCRFLCDALASRCRHEQRPENGASTCDSHRGSPRRLVLRLDIGQNAVGNDGVLAIARLLLGDAGALVELHVEKCGITSVGCVALAAALASDRCLQSLFVSGNPIGDEGMAELASALSANRTLRTLCADLCADVGPEGLKAVLQSLQQSNRSVRQFSACYLRPRGEAAVCNEGAKHDLDELVSLAREALPGRKVTL